MVPFPRTKPSASQVLRMPMFNLTSAVAVSGVNIGSQEMPAAPSWRRTQPSLDVMEWRTVALLLFGCHMDDTDLEHCSAPSPHAVSGTTYALDMSPLYRTLPLFVQAGLDQEWVAWENRPPWETALFPPPSEDPSMCQGVEAPLRWHRLHAALHATLSANHGLSVQLPPRDIPWGHWVSEEEESALERSCDGPLSPNCTAPYLGPAAAHTEEAVPQSLDNCSAVSPTLLRYPLLHPTAAFHRSAFLSASHSLSVAMGPQGRLGHLGAPATLLHGGVTTGRLLSGSTVVEVFGAFDAMHSSRWEGDPPALSPTFQFPQRLSHSGPPTRDAVPLFWATWSDLGDTQGEPPPAMFGATTLDVPASLMGSPFVTDTLPTPGNAFVDPAAAAFIDEVAQQLEVDSDHPTAVTAALSTIEYIKVLTSGAFGHHAATYGSALIQGNGFALTTDTAAENAASIHEEWSREHFMLLIGGCKAPRNSIFGFLVCLYVRIAAICSPSHLRRRSFLVICPHLWICRNFEAFTVLTALQLVEEILSAPNNFERSSFLLHPATLTWLPIDMLPTLTLPGKLTDASCCVYLDNRTYLPSTAEEIRFHSKAVSIPERIVLLPGGTVDSSEIFTPVAKVNLVAPKASRIMFVLDMLLQLRLPSSDGVVFFIFPRHWRSHRYPFAWGRISGGAGVGRFHRISL